MRFLHPALVWWFAGGLAAAALMRWAGARRMGAATTASWIFGRDYRASPFRRLPAAALVGTVILLGGALLDPVLPYSETQIESRGLDIVIALDVSSSMEDQMDRRPAPQPGQNRPAGAPAAATPPGKTRLEATKDAIKAFVGRRVDDRIGLIVFSDNAYVVSPLTYDHAYLTRYIDSVDDQILRGEGLTAIGEGLALSNYLLSRQSASPGRPNKVIVLFTDGESNAGRDPLDALAESDAENIRVHMIGLDLEHDIKKPQVQELLQAIEGYGGRYFSANSSRQLEAASRAIDSIEKGVLISHTYQHDTPVYQWFVVPALVCLAAGFALRAIPAFIDQT